VQRRCERVTSGGGEKNIAAASLTLFGLKPPLDTDSGDNFDFYPPDLRFTFS